MLPCTMNSIFLVAVFALSLIVADPDVLLRPVKTAEPEVGFIFMQGAQIPAERYMPLLRQLQHAFPYALWVGIPSFPLNVVQPLVIEQGYDRMLKNMTAEGMSTRNIIVGGHSLGGAMLQNWLANHPSAAIGQVLMGSFIARKHRNSSLPTNPTQYPVPTLTIGGELDGLCRVSRIAEAYYMQITRSADPNNALLQAPVVVVRGMSHMQFASGSPPYLVKENDLRPEISLEEAHMRVAMISSQYIQALVSSPSTLQNLTKYVSATGVFVEPLVQSMLMEGSYHFTPPCNDQPHTAACQTGSQWSAYAQTQMAGLTNVHYEVIDEFHPVYQINPVHLPALHNNCSAPTSSCTLNVSTVTQNVYAAEDGLDTGFYPTSASEMRVKMKSRQSMMAAAGIPSPDFNATDGGSICSEINAKSFEWALSNASPDTINRFKELGQMYTMGPDLGPFNAGPLWIWKPLEYTAETSGDVVQIRSPMMRTPTNYWIKLSAGFHYCKLLSPARAMEWIYIDSLRAHDSIKSQL